MTRHDRLRTVWEYLILTLACFIFAMAWECFMIPNGMSAGGMMGLCTVIQYATGGLLPAQYSYIAINGILIIVAVIAMGIGFGFKTIWCILVSTLAMDLLGRLHALHAVPGEFFFMEERVLIPIIAGVLEAVGLGLVLRYGGSTGGTDIIALMVNKYWPVSLSTVFLLSDVAICALLLFLPDKNFSDMCYGMEEVVICSSVLDLYLSGSRQSVQLFILSRKSTEIADAMTRDLHRGVTVLKAQGWYTQQPTQVLMVLARKTDLSLMLRYIKAIDPDAFLSVSSVTGVYGKGFERIKSGNRKK